MLFTCQDLAAASFTGSKSCAKCHEEQYDNFMKYSKKAHSSKSIEKLAPKLNQDELKECYSCHTTGYGKNGGFISYQKTPELGDVGCETCHGPGAAHVQSGETSHIVRKPPLDNCLACHNAERIQNFKFKPLRYSGAH
jgi:hypothetical protein